MCGRAGNVLAACAILALLMFHVTTSAVACAGVFIGALAAFSKARLRHFPTEPMHQLPTRGTSPTELAERIVRATVTPWTYAAPFAGSTSQPSPNC